MKMLEKLFGFNPRETRVRTEILAGITTFLTMAYILAVNPNILAATGMDKGAAFHDDSHRFGFCYAVDGLLCPIAFRIGTGNGIECVFCLYRLSYAGLYLAVCSDGCTFGRNYIHSADGNQFA